MPSSLSPGAWQSRFEQQARWTREIRQNLYARLNIHRSKRILDVGCGTGVLAGELCSQTRASVVGLDLNQTFLGLARHSCPSAFYTCSDALLLPFPARSFDIALCHFVLLWLSDPLQALREMRRVTRQGGAVLALAEPDYGGRIDHPAPLIEPGRLQTEALRRQGADPLIGRQLASLFAQAGLIRVETGILGGQWRGKPSAETREDEWKVLEADLKGLLTPARLAELRAIDRMAWESGERVLFVPTFFAVGFVP